MNASRSYLTFTAVLFAIVGLGQLTRAVAEWPVVINGYSIPIGLSYPIAAVALGLSGWAMAQLRQR
jgi:hypothetical protein